MRLKLPNELCNCCCHLIASVRDSVAESEPFDNGERVDAPLHLVPRRADFVCGTRVLREM